MSAGADFLGPLGISMLWCFQFLIPLLLLLLYAFLPMDYSVEPVLTKAELAVEAPMDRDRRLLKEEADKVSRPLWRARKRHPVVPIPCMSRQLRHLGTLVPQASPYTSERQCRRAPEPCARCLAFLRTTSGSPCRSQAIWGFRRGVIKAANVASLLTSFGLFVAILAVAIATSDPGTAYQRGGPGHLSPKATFSHL